MEIHIDRDASAMGKSAAAEGIKKVKAAITAKGHSNIILATGNSQLEMLKQLVQADVDWSKITMFHLDEYIGISAQHPASFQKYLRERFLAPIDFACDHHLLDGEANPEAEAQRMSDLILQHPIDVAFIGIGENGHLAFNDPPADFETEVPYILVTLDEGCRLQQLGEGWFPTLDDVPKQAISMSIQHILKSDHLIVAVPDRRKAEAVAKAIEGPLDNLCPASILRTHPSAFIYLDEASASLLSTQ